MAPRPISKTRFAELVRDRLMDADQVREAFGYRSSQSVYAAVSRGKIPEPILQGGERRYSFWDRLAIEPLTRR